MHFSKTVAAQCRYGEIAEELWHEWDVLWEDSEADYQGHASFLAKRGNEYVFYEWHYGSCSGCDGWEADDMSNEEIAEEMHRTAAYFKSKDELKNWLEMMQGTYPASQASMEAGGGLAYGIDWLSGGMRTRIEAIRKELGMGPLPKN